MVVGSGEARGVDGLMKFQQSPPRSNEPSSDGLLNLVVELNGSTDRVCLVVLVIGAAIQFYTNVISPRKETEHCSQVDMVAEVSSRKMGEWSERGGW